MAGAGGNGAYMPYSAGQQMGGGQGSPYGDAAGYQQQWGAAPGSVKAPIEMSAQGGPAVSEMPAGRNVMAAELPAESQGRR